MNTQEIKLLKEKLREGEVFFAYRKKDGTIRKARGTLRMDMIPQSYQPMMRPTAPENIRYWDLDAETYGGCKWRSFIPENFIGFISDDEYMDDNWTAPNEDSNDQCGNHDCGYSQWL